MVELTTILTLPAGSAQGIYRFMRDNNDASYRRWWPGVHLQWHTVAGTPGTEGSTVFLEEWVGRRRLRFHGVLVDLQENVRIGWQMQKLVRLPVRLTIELREGHQGVTLTHSLRMGFSGAGRLLDPLVHLWLGRHFAADFAQHIRTEFPMLVQQLAQGDAPSPPGA